MIYDPKNYTYDGLIVAMEFWKDITDEMVPGVRPVYMISSLGNLYNKETGQFSNASIKPNDYIRVILRDVDGNQISTTIHRLVCLAFNGPCPGPGYEVDHINCDRTCSFYQNLEFVPKRENTRRAVEKGRHEFGERRYNAKMTNDEVREICEMLSKGIPIKEIAEIMENKIYPRKYKSMINIIHQILNREDWSCISKDYVFHNYNRTHLSDEMAKIACEYMQRGVGYDDIIDNILHLDVDSNERERLKESLYKMKKHESYKSISSQYSFDKDLSNDLTDDEINLICKMVALGNGPDEIFPLFGERRYEKKIKNMVYGVYSGKTNKILVSKYKEKLNQGSTTIEKGSSNEDLTE